MTENEMNAYLREYVAVLEEITIRYGKKETNDIINVVRINNLEKQLQGG